MIKNSLSEPDLKLLINFLKLAIESHLEFQAVYEKVMRHSHIQTKLFESLTNKKDSFIDVLIKRKPRKIPLMFSKTFEPVTSNQKTQPVESITYLSTIQTQVVDSAIDSNITQTQVIDSEKLIKRKGRGKAKKQPPSRSLISVLVDDSCINKLDELATKYNMNFSQVVRAALLSYSQRFT